MEKKKQNNRSRRLKLALFMLLVSGIAFTTATYAWFSANRVVTVEDIDVKVTASSGITISADALAFDKSINYSEVVNFAEKVYDGDYTSVGIAAPSVSVLSNPELLNPVTTIGNNGTGWNFFTGQLNEDDDTTVLLANATAGSTWKVQDGVKTGYTNGDYIAFDVYLRTSTSQDVKLSTNSRISNIKIGAMDGAMESLDTALRVGFQYLGSTNKSSQKDAYALSDTSDSQWAIWNPVPWKSHVSSLTDYYDGADTEETVGYYAGIGNSSNTFVKHYYKDLTATPNDTLFKSIKTVAGTKYMQSQNTVDGIVNPDTKIFTLQPGINKVRIYIWLEGQDKDCVDSITLSDGLSLNLGFEAITA